MSCWLWRSYFLGWTDLNWWFVSLFCVYFSVSLCNRYQYFEYIFYIYNIFSAVLKVLGVLNFWKNFEGNWELFFHLQLDLKCFKYFQCKMKFRILWNGHFFCFLFLLMNWLYHISWWTFYWYSLYLARTRESNAFK